MSSFMITGSSQEARLAEAVKLSERNSRGVDLQIFEDVKTISQVRGILTTFRLKPYQSKKISAIIPEADLLSADAQSTLLKTLEDPPGENDLYLLTGSVDSLLPTVRSRCQVINLGPKQINVSGDELKNTWELYKKGSLANLFDQSHQANPAVWAELFRQILLFQMGGGKLLQASAITPLTNLVSEEEVKKVADSVDEKSLHKFLHLSQEVADGLAQNANKRLALENLFLEIPRPKLSHKIV